MPTQNVTTHDTKNKNWLFLFSVLKPYQILILENEWFVASGFIQDNGQDEIRDRDRPEEDRDDGRKDKFLGSIKKLFCC